MPKRGKTASSRLATDDDGFLYYLQQYFLAQTHAQAAIELATELAAPATEGYAQDVLGPAVLLETQAGLAQADLLEGAPAVTLARLEDALPALLARPPEGMEDTFAVYAVTHQVLLALGDARAAVVYQHARQFLIERAASLQSEQQRITFLNAIASHRYFRTENP